MKPSIKFGAVAGAVALAATAALTAATAATGGKSDIAPSGPPPQYAGAVTTSCPVQTVLSANHKKVDVGTQVTVAGTGTPVGTVSIVLDGNPSTAKVVNKYAGGSVSKTFGGLTAGSHTVVVTYEAPYSSVFSNCTASSTFTS